MAGSVNKVILVGNLGRDPEIRSTREGTRHIAKQNRNHVVPGTERGLRGIARGLRNPRAYVAEQFARRYGPFPKRHDVVGAPLDLKLFATYLQHKQENRYFTMLYG